MGYCPEPEKDHSQCCCPHHSVMQLSAQYLMTWFSWARVFFAVHMYIATHRDVDDRVMFGRDMQMCTYVLVSITEESLQDAEVQTHVDIYLRI